MKKIWIVLFVELMSMLFLGKAHAAGINRISVDASQIGNPSSPDTKKIQFRMAGVSSYPEMGFNPSYPDQFETSADDVQVGSTPTTDKKVSFNMGLGSSNPAFGYAYSSSKFKFFNSGFSTGLAHINSSGEITSSAVALGTADVSGQLPFANLDSLTASRAVVTNPSGVLTISTATAAQIGFLDTVSSNIQNQIDSKQNTGNYITDLSGDAVASGPGVATVTISNLALTKLAPLTFNKALVSNGSGAISASTTTATQIGYLDTLTSNVQSQINAIVSSSGSVTLGGDATGPSGSNTVATVGGKTAASIATSVNDTQAASSPNTPSTIVKRDGSGNFSAGTITATLSGTATNVSGTVAVANGGTNKTSWTDGFVKVVSNTFSSVSTLVFGTDVVGSVSTASLSGTVLPNQGGTGKTSYNAGDLLYAINSTTLAVISDPGTVSTVLTNLGNHSFAWTAPASGGGGSANWVVKANIEDPAGGAVTMGTASKTAFTEMTQASLNMSLASYSITAEIPCATGTASSGLNCNAAVVSEAMGVAFTPTTNCNGGVMEVCFHTNVEIYCNTGTSTCYGEDTLSVMETNNSNNTILNEGNEYNLAAYEIAQNATRQVDSIYERHTCGYFSGRTSKSTFRLMYKKPADSNVALHNLISGLGNPTRSNQATSVVAHCM